MPGRETVDPAFGLPALWIGEAERDEAEILGYTVIDPTSVLVTHLSETLRKAKAELLTRDDVKETGRERPQTSRRRSSRSSCLRRWATARSRRSCATC